MEIENLMAQKEAEQQLTEPVQNYTGVKIEKQAIMFRFCWDCWAAVT